jgi:hypothetical protein
MSGGPSDIAVRWSRGDSIQSFTPAERERLRQDMRAHAGALSPKDPERARFMTDLRALYEADHPNQSEPNTICINGRIVDLDAPRGAR